MDLYRYYKALDAVKSIKKDVQAQKDLTDKQTKALEQEARDKVYALEDQIRDIKRKSDSAIEDLKEKLKEYEASRGREPFDKDIQDTQDLFKCIDISLRPSSRAEVKGTVLADDPYKQIFVYIAKSRKPVNKFSLVIAVHSIFERTFEDLFPFNQETSLKDGPTEEALTSWFEKNKSSFKIPRRRSGDISIKDFLGMHKTLEGKYEDARSAFLDKNWQRAYWIYKKDYYENFYSHGTSTGQYKEACEMLELLNTLPQDLPLVLPEVKSESAKEWVKQELVRIGKS